MNTQPHYVSDKTLSARYEVSRSTIWRWTSEGRLPKPIKIFGSTRWNLADIEILEQGLPLK